MMSKRIWRLSFLVLGARWSCSRCWGRSCCRPHWCFSGQILPTKRFTNSHYNSSTTVENSVVNFSRQSSSRVPLSVLIIHQFSATWLWEFLWRGCNGCWFLMNYVFNWWFFLYSNKIRKRHSRLLFLYDRRRRRYLLFLHSQKGCQKALFLHGCNHCHPIPIHNQCRSSRFCKTSLWREPGGFSFDSFVLLFLSFALWLFSVFLGGLFK